MRIIFVFLLALLSGCSTGYHSANDPVLGLSGGFLHQEGPGELIKVGFYGNGYTDRDKVGLYLMYRCAELVKEQGKNHFVMYKSVPHAIADRPQSKSYVSSIGYHPAAEVYILIEDTEREQSFSANDIIEKHSKEVKGNG